MIETSVMYVSAQTSVKVLRMAAMATTIGSSTAGSVPNTNSRITSAPTPPTIASIRTRGAAARSAASLPRPARRGP